jgi:hypothetical protein
MKKIIIVSAVVIFIASAFYRFVIYVPQSTTDSATLPAASAPLNTAPNTAQSVVNPADTTQATQANTDDTVELTPEMKEALRKVLFQHGPKTTITHPDGTIELPMNGRYTQMPVAIQKPDGTIEIREYSVVPENKNEKP